ncbi:MAG: sodium/solute symporter, partial [Bdellovibrionales bacterium]|nr:sodium/solute symporter [Bdellovibrionales bacterium]
MLQLHWIDLTILAAYLVGVLVLGLYVASREEGTSEEYFVAGRKLGWFVIGASLFASNISSEHLVGLAADGFRTGFGVGNYELSASLILIILGAVFVPFYIGTRIQTLPEFLEKRFGSGARIYLSAMTVTANVLVRISVALFAGGLVIEKIFGITFWVGIVVLALVTVLYTAAGGLKAVVYTDVAQTVILLMGTAVITLLALERVGGWEALRASLEPSMFDMVRPASDPEMPWTGLVFGVPVLGIWYWCTDQVIAQRVLGAKDLQNARMGALFAGFLKILPLFLFVLPGLCGRVLFPETSPNEIFPKLVTEILPIGAKGLVAAALIAALMSSIDSTLNSTGTLIALDFYSKWKKKSEPTQKELVKVGRVSTVVVMVFGILWVHVVMRAESLFQYLQQVNAAISPPIAAAFVVGVFWKRANHKGVLTALLGGFAFGIALLAWNAFPFLI